jgi:hypothetical protein
MKGSLAPRASPERRRRTPAASWRHRLTQKGLASAGVVFRTTSGLGALLFVLEYAQLIKVSVHSKSSVPRMDWNVFETTALDLSSSTDRTTYNASASVVGGGESAATLDTTPPPLVLPAWVQCADGRNVSSCHACAATNVILSCDDSSDCQWCPYGAAFGTRSNNTVTPGVRRHADGVVVHNAHVPLGQQCVSVLATCRPPASALYDAEVQRRVRPAVATLVTKASVQTMQQRCKARGFQPCPYGALTSYHDQLRNATNSSSSSTSLLQQHPRAVQCIPKAFHCQPPDDLLVAPWDVLYRKRYGSALVLPAYRLIVVPTPKVGSTVWHQLFRRMMGYADWKAHTGPLPHNPDANGLTYLADYSRPAASDLWQSPQWTKAIFVRDPKERLLSAYLDKVARNPSQNLVKGSCCPKLPRDCVHRNTSLTDFAHLVGTSCLRKGDHWNLQSERMEPKYWTYVNFVGNLETAAPDARRLLEQLGAWQDFGASGWGKDGQQAIFAEVQDIHQTDAASKMSNYYTADLEAYVEQMYAADYNHSRMGLSLRSSLAS